MGIMWFNKRKQSFLCQSPNIMFTADNDSTLICLPLHQAISSFQSNVVKWQVTKRCSRDSSNIPQKVHNEESILPIFFQKRIIVTKYLFIILYWNPRDFVSNVTRKQQTVNFLPVQTDATEAFIKLWVSCRWSGNSRDYLAINFLKGHLSDRGLLVIENKLNLVLNNKRTLVQVPIYFQGLSPRCRDCIN